ncbi:MAG: endonuclease III [Clostridia bacterium]|nr:endonuclease III [Clostridia bacterium]
MKVRKKEILRVLEESYPDARPELNFSNPYETLVAVMLSAQCTDKQVNKVTPAVFRDFPDVASMAAIDADTLYPYVKSCGFKSKSQNIVSACRMIMEKFGGQVPADMDKLTSLPGVGRKTANVVLATAFGQPAIAVDTHVFRVSNRLGLAEADNVLDTEMQLRRAIPKQDWSAAHHWLIFHGRRVCSARNPKCDTCPLKELCKDYHMRTHPQKENAHEPDALSL